MANASPRSSPSVQKVRLARAISVLEKSLDAPKIRFYSTTAVFRRRILRVLQDSSTRTSVVSMGGVLNVPMDGRSAPVTNDVYRARRSVHRVKSPTTVAASSRHSVLATNSALFQLLGLVFNLAVSGAIS